MDKDKFNIFIYVIHGSKRIKEFEKLNYVEIKDIRFNKFNPLSFLRIINFLRSDNIEIIHSYPFISNLIGPFLAKIAGVKKIITSIHSQTIIRNRFVRRLSYDLSDTVIVVSRYLKKFLIEDRIVSDTNKIISIHNGIDLELFKPENIRFRDREEIKIPNDEIVVMTVSKFRWERGLEYIIEAIAKIKKTGDKFKFIFVGDGVVLEDKIKSMAKEFDVEDKITFMGYKDNVPELLSFCDIFLLPSISEGVGMIALLEAMVMKKPIITTAIGGIPEMLKDQESALLIKPANPDAIVNALRRLANNRSLCQTMCENARKIAENNFKAKDKVKELEGVYLDSDDESTSLEHVACDLCGADDAKFLFSDNSYRLVRCRTCHLVYVDPRPKEPIVDKLYDEKISDIDSYFEYYKEYIIHENGFVAEAKDLLKSIKKYIKSGRILDIGCACGFFLNVAKQDGWETHGVEISRYLSGYAREKFGLNVFTGELEKANFSERYFDVVTMFDLLSHLQSPTTTLKEVHRVLRDGGLLMMKCGNKGRLKTKRKGEISWGSPDHLYHFSEKNISELLEKSGFKIVKMYNEAIMPFLFNHKGPGVYRDSRVKNLVYRYKFLFAKPYRLFRKTLRSTIGRILGYFPVDSIVMVYAVKN